MIVENRRLKLLNLKTWKITKTLPGKTCGKWVPYVGYLKSRKGKDSFILDEVIENPI